MKGVSGLAFLLLVATGVAQQPGSQVEREQISEQEQLAQLRARVETLEADLAKQRQDQEVINGRILGILDLTSERLFEFLQAVQGGGVQLMGTPPTFQLEVQPEAQPRLETDARAALWVSVGAALLALLALFWKRRSPRLNGTAADRPVEEQLGGSEEEKPHVAGELSTEVSMDPVMELPGKDGEGKQPGELPGSDPVGDLSVEQVGRGELGLANVSPVELEAPEESAGPVAPGPPPRVVEWKLACANPAVGETLVRELLNAEPRVLQTPPARVEGEDYALRIAYCVHPDLVVADRTQIATRLIEVLRSVPPPDAVRDEPGLPVG